MTLTEAMSRVQAELIKNDSVFSGKEQTVEESLKDADAITFLTMLKTKLKGR